MTNPNERVSMTISQYETLLHLRPKVTDMLEAAEAAYQDAAAMHSMGKVSHHGGRIAAFKAVLALMDA